MKLAADHPTYYDVQTLGIPISDLDSIATVGTFSTILMHLSLPRQGIFLTQKETADYTALWRYIAHLLGTPTDYFETSEKAKQTMEALVLYEVKPTETSKILANNIIKSLAGQPPGFASEDFLLMNARWLNGGQLADELGLAKPRWWYWGLAVGQCFFFMGICYFYRSIPYLDGRKIAVSPSLSHPSLSFSFLSNEAKKLRAQSQSYMYARLSAAFSGTSSSRMKTVSPASNPLSTSNTSPTYRNARYERMPPRSRT